MSKEIVGKIEASVNRETRDTYLGMAVIEHLFDDWRTSKIIIEMDTRNPASIRLAESLVAKRVEFKPKAEFFKGSWSDEYVYELLAKR